MNSITTPRVKANRWKYRFVRYCTKFPHDSIRRKFYYTTDQPATPWFVENPFRASDHIGFTVDGGRALFMENLDDQVYRTRSPDAYAF